MNERIREKLNILADAAKYDVSCASGGGKRKNNNKGLGDSSRSGICHSYTEDGRCVSLLKILLTNHCIYDCAYCVSRKSNDIKRVAFTVNEVVDLTINFYRRNYIEGLFLSSGIFKNSDYTLERLVLVAKKLRTEHKFNGYIHLKTIPGASSELVKLAGLYADRLSINLELPSEKSLKLLAPEKNYHDITTPMGYVKNEIIAIKDAKKHIRSTPSFAPAGQSTQMIIGATAETDSDILKTADHFYKEYDMRRVYYSGYIPVMSDIRLPPAGIAVPTARENRLYQADWLLRFYDFKVNELFTPETGGSLDYDIDPKLSWALRNPQFFPVDINTATYGMLLRIPGVGRPSVNKIITARKHQQLNIENLKALGFAFNRAKYFITCKGYTNHQEYTPGVLKMKVLNESTSKYLKNIPAQLNLFQ